MQQQDNISTDTERRAGLWAIAELLVYENVAYFGVVQVSCAVRSYWLRLPAVKSSFMFGVADYFIGLKCYSVYFCMNVVCYGNDSCDSYLYCTASLFQVPVQNESCQAPLCVIDLHDRKYTLEPFLNV